MTSPTHLDESYARPVGQLESFSTSRHSLGFYRSVAQTARYLVPAALLPGESIETVIEQAVAQAILAHPILQVGIKGEDTKKPYFAHLPSLNLAQIVRWIDVGPETDRDEALGRILEDRHSTRWPDLAHRPGSEVIVLRPRSGALSTETEALKLDIVFSWHHALGDGTSGAIFQRTLLDALNNPLPIPSLSSASRILTLTRSTLLPPQESLINFPLSWTFLLNILWGQFAPSFLRAATEPFWTGKPVTPDHNTTHLRLVTFPAPTVSRILAHTKNHSTTLTPLFHVLIAQSLATRVTASAGTAGFKSTTPISLRRFLPASSNVDPATAMGVIITAENHAFPPSTIDQLRANPDESQIWSLSTTLRAELKAKVASLPADDQIGLLGRVTDFHQFFLKKVGKQRESTWEVSNVGAVDMATPGGWKVDRMVFSQSGSVAGSAFGVNVVAINGGELTVTLTWQEGIIEEEVVDGVAEDLGTWLTGLAESGRLGLASNVDIPHIDGWQSH